MNNELYENEKVELFQQDNVNEIKLTNDEINEKYKKGEVRIITEQARYPLNTIVNMVNSDDYILNPEFQRRHRWDTTRKSKLIESFIMNVPIPPIFLYEREYSVYEVMDGLQRLTAISQFYEDRFSLQDLAEWKELNGLKYSELPEQIRKGIDRRYISSIILLQETAKSETEANRLKQLVFERINSGGEKLKAQEIRNALFPGGLNNLTIGLSRNKYFCRLWDIPEPDDTELSTGQPRQEVIEDKYFKDMSDAELVLRFFAYRQIDQWQGNTMEFFLDEFLKKGNEQFTEEVLNNLKKTFNDTVEFAYNLFEQKAFWLHRNREEKWFHYERPTKILYDPLMQVLANNLDNKEKILIKKQEIIGGLENFHKTKYDGFKGRDTNKTKVTDRIEILNEYINSFINE
ncbi:DUF262 domain-containing protein [Flavobacterium muglaense]|uniref:DUF262 domain-containing protein n=1 Tax=Flavobacterium muglaense TaxID=2764716 RepID=A0A923SI17_9FLAO|nr:DUF262 domain-containing protein [Flavobacterium muglaense]MBC5839742.1 DUF262 domain-containing protein [Flavobacterium muglaense]MBC5846269.1 DUF262 domain-containing protein [Flavobacterium muglaense]